MEGTLQPPSFVAGFSGFDDLRPFCTKAKQTFRKMKSCCRTSWQDEIRHFRESASNAFSISRAQRVGIGLAIREWYRLH